MGGSLSPRDPELESARPSIITVIANKLLLSVGDFWQAPKREMGLTTERAALAILLACVLMYVRGLVEVGVVHPPLPTIVWLPVGGVCLAGLTYRGSLYSVE
ncbi:MAG: hypothetical protein BRD35_00770, partial [Bacteroidetes bacterium QH_7_62_13]